VVKTIAEHQKSIFEWVDAEKKERPTGEELSQPNPEKNLERLKEKCLACQLCGLRKGCQQVVFGDGDPAARLMLIGEGPGADEDRIGVPFVGRAGQLLDKILEAANIRRSDVYIANIVKCRPPSNRLPLQPEVEACLPYLREQVTMIDPEIIICLGALAMRTLIDRNATISRTRGHWHMIEGRRMIATYHPAALLRDPGKKKDVWADFKEVMKYYHPS
jgi:uracil-DNA glycosylase